MAKQSIACYVIPAIPLPILLPVECVASVLEKPSLEKLTDAPANWMSGYVTWENQRVPTLSYSMLQDAALDESKKRKMRAVILNPIPDAARKAYSAILCYGDVVQQEIDATSEYVDLPEKLDRRYVEAVVGIDDKSYIVPKLAALGVAFSYF